MSRKIRDLGRVLFFNEWLAKRSLCGSSFCIRYTIRRHTLVYFFRSNGRISLGQGEKNSGVVDHFTIISTIISLVQTCTRLTSVPIEIIADASDAVSYAVTYILGAVLYRISVEYDKESDMNLMWTFFDTMLFILRDIYTFSCLRYN